MLVKFQISAFLFNLACFTFSASYGFVVFLASNADATLSNADLTLGNADATLSNSDAALSYADVTPSNADATLSNFDTKQCQCQV